jgi:hypothetical protein
MMKARGTGLSRWAKIIAAIAGAAGLWAILAMIGIRSATAQVVATPIIAVIAVGLFELIARLVALFSDNGTVHGDAASQTSEDDQHVNLIGVATGVLTLILALVLQATVAPTVGAIVAILSLAYVVYLMYGGIFR